MAVLGAQRLPGGVVRFETDAGPLELPEGAPGVSEAMASMAGPELMPAPAPPEGRLASAAPGGFAAEFMAPPPTPATPTAPTFAGEYLAAPDAGVPRPPPGSRIVNPLAPQPAPQGPGGLDLNALLRPSGGGPVRVIPGQMQERQRTVEKGIQLPDEVRALQGRSEQAMRAAGATEIEVAKEKAAIEAQWASDLEDVHTDQRIQQQQREEQRQQKVQGVLAERDKAIDALTQTKINPDRYWQNKGTFSKVLSFIGITLGGGLSARYGTQNEALEAVKAGIKEDIQIQRDERNAQGQRAEALNTVYSQMLDQFKREDLASEASYQFGLEQMKRELDARLQSGGIKDREIEAQGIRAIAQLDSEILQSRIKFEQLTQDHVTSTEVRTPDRVTGGGGDPLKNLRRVKEALDLKLGIEQSLGKLAGNPDVDPKDVQGYAKDLQEMNLVDRKAKLAELKNLATQHKGDLPGFGSLAGAVPDILTESAGVLLRQRAGETLASQLKATSGVGVSDKERAAMGKTFGLAPGAFVEEQQFWNGIQLIEEKIKADEQTLGIKYPTVHGKVPIGPPTGTGSASLPSLNPRSPK